MSDFHLETLPDSAVYYVVDIAMHCTYVLEVLRGQPTKLIQVVFTSKLHKNLWNNLVFLKIVPSGFCMASILM